MAENIFRQAKTLLDTKNGSEMTEEEQHLVATAAIPLMVSEKYSETPIGEGLEQLARMVEEANEPRR